MGEPSNNSRRQLFTEDKQHQNYGNGMKTKNNKNISITVKNENQKLQNFIAITGITERFPNYWKELREQKQFCDAIITLSSGNKLKVHRIVLSSCSEVFKTMFTYSSETISSPLGKKKPQKIILSTDDIEMDEITLDVTDSTMEAILDYAYLGSCNINWLNVEDLFTSADRYGINGVIQLCLDFFDKNFCPENCIGIYIFGKNYFCCKLENMAKNFILKNFTNVLEWSDELKQLDGNDLKEMLSDEILNVRNEMIVFNAIKKWIEYDPGERLNYIKDLLKCIRIGLLQSKSYKEIENWEYFKNLDNIDLKASPLQCKPRIPNEVIVVIGGWINGGPSVIIEIYDPRADMWLIMRHTDTQRVYHCICTVNQKIYVLGGFNGVSYYNSVRCFDPINCTWEEKACMYHQRCYLSVAVLGEKIYAMGGYNGHIRLNSVERYDPEKNQWELIASMKKVRSDASAVAYGNNIYVVGGFDGNEACTSCEMYNVEKNQWTIISHTLTARCGLGLIACNDHLYAIGGYVGNARLTSVERINLNDVNSKWIYVASMMTPRSNFAVAVMDQIIYVMGGYNGKYPIRFVEQYNPKENDWRAAGQMSYAKSAPSACILKDLPNIKAFSLQCFDLGEESPCYLKLNYSNKEKLSKFGIIEEKEIEDNI